LYHAIKQARKKQCTSTNIEGFRQLVDFLRQSTIEENEIDVLDHSVSNLELSLKTACNTLEKHQNAVRKFISES
jgi:hypothetical protein